MLRHRGQFQPAGGGHDLLFIHLNTRQGNALTPARDHDVLGGIFLAGDADHAGGGDAALTLQPGNLVLAEQEFDTLHIGANHFTLARLHPRQVKLHRANTHAMIGEFVLRFFKNLRRLQQSLGRDAADIQAGAAQRFTLFHAGDLHAQLRGADGAHITAGAGANHDHIKSITHGQASSTFVFSPPCLDRSGGPIKSWN